MTSRPLRIVYLADVRFPIERANGIQTVETCYALAERGHEVALVVRPDTREPARDPFAYYGLAPAAALRIERAPVRGPATARRIGYLSFAAGRILAGGADLAMTRDLGVAALLLRLPRGARPPLVYESHGYAPDVAAALPQLIPNAPAASRFKLSRLARREARVWREADGYVTITAALAGDLQERFGARDRLRVIPDGVRIAGDTGAGDPAVQEPAAAHMTPIVAYAGHLYAWKGVDVLLEALALVPGVRGLIVGGHASEPDLARLQGIAGRLGLADRVTFTGMVEPGRVAALLRTASVLVLPNPASAISDRFTSPLKLFEYMAAGCAIVASDLPSIREVLHDDVEGVLVRPGDAAALAAAIERLASDRVTAERLGRAAAAAAPAYSWQRRAGRLEELFLDVIARAR